MIKEQQSFIEQNKDSRIDILRKWTQIYKEISLGISEDVTGDEYHSIFREKLKERIPLVALIDVLRDIREDLEGLELAYDRVLGESATGDDTDKKYEVMLKEIDSLNENLKRLPLKVEIK
ncbi:MAG: hypothetical protein HY445_03625 [Candidatus Niyogibacteria bacterium]|nr:hypothetical protein [Candidatus Niyogibacteria bacterium]